MAKDLSSTKLKMKNTVYIKKSNIENLDCVCCVPKDLISVKGMELLVKSPNEFGLMEGKSYELCIDITNGEPDQEGYQYFFLENEPILDQLNEYYQFKADGTISEKDFDTLLEGKVGIFESEIGVGIKGYQIIGQVQGEYLIANDVCFYIGKKREAQNNKFLIAYCDAPILCQDLPHEHN